MNFAPLKVSIITVCYNSEKFIRNAVDSVLCQSYQDIEYIIIDGGSTDNTVEIVRSYGSKISKFISEPDKGIYDAMNKGLKMATGDIIAILNSDDFYAGSEVIKNITGAFADETTLIAYGDLQVVDRDNTDKIIRLYKADKFTLKSLKYGIMPGHATIFLRKKIFEQYGYYKTDYRIAADFDFVVRVLYKHKIPAVYVPQIVLKARVGGISTDGIMTKFAISKEVLRACRENGLRSNLIKVNLRMIIKIKQLILAKK